MVVMVNLLFCCYCGDKVGSKLIWLLSILVVIPIFIFEFYLSSTSVLKLNKNLDFCLKSLTSVNCHLMPQTL